MCLHWKLSPASPVPASPVQPPLSQPPPVQPPPIQPHTPHCLPTNWQPYSLVLYRGVRTHKLIHKCTSNDRVSQQPIEPVTQTQFSRKPLVRSHPLHSTQVAQYDHSLPPPRSPCAGASQTPHRWSPSSQTSLPAHHTPCGMQAHTLRSQTQSVTRTSPS